MVSRLRLPKGVRVSKQLNTEETNVTENVSEEIKLSCTWLQNNTEPWSTVLTHWSVTSNFRTSEIINTEAEVQKTIDKWSPLKHSLGYTLVSKA